MIARNVYRLLLSLHPPAFQERFSREMLWVFDQTVGGEGALSLLADVGLSLFKQHLATEATPRRAGSLFQQSPTESLHVMRIVQASSVALPLLFAFFSLLQQSVPLPEPPRQLAVRRYVPDICGELIGAVRPAELHHNFQAAPTVSRVRR